jgi:uncharacterized protein YjfI (DUF2170 family)
MVGLSPPEFWIARTCIGTSAAIFGGVSLIWLCVSTWPLTGRVFIAALIGATALLGFSEAIRWVNNREKGLIFAAAQTSDTRIAIRAHLQQLFIENGNLLEFPIPKDTSQEAFNRYVNTVQNWIDVSSQWIADNLGEAAKAKFQDRSSAQPINYDRAYNGLHNNIIATLVCFRKNLSTLIETSAWDSIPPKKPSTIPQIAPLATPIPSSLQ